MTTESNTADTIIIYKSYTPAMKNYQEKYRAAHREKINEYKRRYYANLPEEKKKEMLQKMSARRRERNLERELDDILEQANDDDAKRIIT